MILRTIMVVVIIIIIIKLTMVIEKWAFMVKQSIPVRVCVN